ncbi:hypothetical protein PF004_g26976 [Phytophthora fragariae]|uniref:Secreted protein n=1 Tax=Phytophthora fragariae TaxID=53985 RepID=A0A6G0MN01_9STRA|nr:hypothetical protein PF004_g26976 [Phytophthora fragariae]
MLMGRAHYIALLFRTTQSSVCVLPNLPTIGFEGSGYTSKGPPDTQRNARCGTPRTPGYTCIRPGIYIVQCAYHECSIP